MERQTTETLKSSLDSVQDTVIPVNVVRHLLRLGGCEVKDTYALKALAVETQRYIGEIANDARHRAVTKRLIADAARSEDEKTTTPAAKRRKLEESSTTIKASERSEESLMKTLTKVDLMECLSERKIAQNRVSAVIVTRRDDDDDRQ